MCVKLTNIVHIINGLPYFRNTSIELHQFSSGSCCKIIITKWLGQNDGFDFEGLVLGNPCNPSLLEGGSWVKGRYQDREFNYRNITPSPLQKIRGRMQRVFTR